MPSSRMPRVPSLMFSLEIEEDGCDQQPNQLGADIIARRSALVEQIRSEMSAGSTAERKVSQLVHESQAAARQSDSDLTLESLARQLQDAGHPVCLRTAIGGGSGTDCMSNLRHQFLLVSPSAGDSESATLIVDIEFRAQFEVAHPTTAYQHLLDGIDTTFIGTEDKLRRVTQILCAEMAEAFKESGDVLPPWRRASSMLSKWCPRISEDRTPGGSLKQKSAAPRKVTRVTPGRVPRLPFMPHCSKVHDQVSLMPWESVIAK